MLTLSDISYSYSKGRTALDSITAAVEPGITLLLGPNGAGKSTLLGILAAALLPASGTATLDGDPIPARDPDSLSRIFHLPDDYTSPFRTIADMARYHAPFYPRFDADTLRDNLSAFGLTGRERLRRLSLGMAHKAYIAFALALRPDLLLLDEPANGLDIDSKKTLRHLVSTCVQPDQTVVISTHTVADLEMLYDNVIMLDKGSLVAALSTDTIQRSLAFTSASMPTPDALYSEPLAGTLRTILPADAPYQTAIDYELLYSALMTDARRPILDHLTTSPNQ